MNIALLYNERAGGAFSLTTLRQLLEAHGHTVAHVVEKDAEIARALDGSTDLVVAAGGDGTVWRAANALVGQSLPLAILPLGTANNVATSLGIEGDPRDVIARWATARRRPFDTGLLRCGSSEGRFIEGVGGGLIPAGIAAMKSVERDSREDADDATESGRSKRAEGTGANANASASASANARASGRASASAEEVTDAKKERALRLYHEALSPLRPRHCVLTLDDDLRLEEEFLLVEVLNIRTVGPNIELCPDADPSDGLFDVVAVGEAHRAELAAYLKLRIAGRDTRLQLPVRRARRVRIEGLGEMHVDDEVRPASPGEAAEIEIEPAAVQVLAPPEDGSAA